MLRMRRIVLLAGLVALTPILSACENMDMDKFDVFGLNEKKKLPGDRRALFPTGVPGVQQGIPPEYLKANQLPPDAQTPLAGQDNKTPGAQPGSKTAAADPVDEPKPKPKAKPKPKPAVASQPAQFPTRITVSPQGQQQPQDQQPAQAQAPWPTQGQSGGSGPWPTSPSPTTR